ncbi:monovalent cation/H+ antiporter subunit D [Salinarchaeum sp. Harcht-Bsk1]|uniref:proton-conducting transporter transmembrane domain-containing protein n=1 Tax=Salinarchaeum sp. Harcht-Bsk1 TaxID=1333523 RepID=UPI00034239E7|nr:proton-conducting transporter membrane subunit [Salinarchaeum sp. Harcht-Bsk1]AGN00093.1 monovalent cation/H+ antiporter subunit D [Salinarchaeum sp. Harcht-Bsk1]
MSDVTLAPVLLIALPIVAAALTLVVGLRWPTAGWSMALLAMLGEAGLAAWLANAVYGEQGRIVHELGAYGRPGPENFAVGIELVADALTGVMVGLIAVVALAVLAVTRRAGPRGTPFYAAYLLLIAGLMGVVLTGDVFNLFVFLEITGIATYTLVASDRSAPAAVASLKYLIVGTTGASLYLLGVGYLLMATGTLNMADLSATLAGEPSFVDGPLYTDTLVLASYAFIATGLFVKSAIFPLHTWQPGAYAEAPDGVTVLISALASTIGAYAFLRITLTVFTPAFFAATPIVATTIVTLASISVVAGSALAVMQSRVKRVFAYSSVSQFGLIVTAVGIAVHPDAGASASEAALVGAVIHLVGHAIVKGGLFAAAMGLARDAGARRVRDLAGLGRESPVLSASLAVLGFTLVGVPPAVGFLGKWYIAVGAIDAGIWPVAAVILLSTVFTLAYVARIVEQLYFTPSPSAGDVGVDVDADAPSDESGGRAVAADGGAVEDGTLDGVPFGIVAVAVAAAIMAVLLGFAGPELSDAIDPFVTEVLGQ